MTAQEAASTHPIDRALAAIDENPVLAADHALSALAVTRGHRADTETAYYLDVLGHAVCRARGLSRSIDGSFRAMTDETVCHDLACAVVIRLLVADDAALAEPRLNGTAPLVDRVAGPRIYRNLGISTKSQTFEKVEALRTALTNAEAQLQQHVDSLGSLDALAAFRQELNRLLNDPMIQLAVRPFMPAETTPQTIAEVIAAAQAVAEAADEELLETAETALHRTEVLAHAAASLPTSYSRAVIGSLAAQLGELIRHRVRERGLADPAAIACHVRDKHYPLANTGSELVVRIDLVNSGPGAARDVTISLEGHQHVHFEEARRVIGHLPPGKRRVDFAGAVTGATNADALLIRVTWRNADGSESEIEQIVDLIAWQRDVPWDELAYADPYPLEPVRRAGQFVGRERTLADLAKIMLGPTLGAARIVGQRRVGKTSVVLALADRLDELRSGEFSFIYIESGDFNANTAQETVMRLGELLARKILETDPRLAKLSAPDFSGGLSPLTDLLEQAETLAPERRFILALDEFDAMPDPDLYGRGPVATALFQTVRSLGSKPNVGFIIIGGERMRFLIANHGLALNKFQFVPVDYFDEEHYEDYRALVTEPVAAWFDVDDAAVHLLHAATAGNPWISKLILRELFTRAATNRDGDIRAEDVAAAIEAALPKLGASSFQHYWDDANQGDVEEQEYVSVTRRKVLLAIASCLRSGEPLTQRTICAASRRYGLEEAVAEDVVRGFRERQILVDRTDGSLQARVPLFFRWLEGEGVHEIVVTMGDDDALIRRQRIQEALRPKFEELEALAAQWRTYQSQLVEAREIRRWLTQFGESRNQRLMLQLLQRLRYFNAAQIAERLRELHGFVIRDLAARGYQYTMTGKQRLRDDFVVCGLEGGGSGAAHLVKPYRDENGIYAARAVDAAEVPAVVREASERVRAVIVLEDFIATGGTAKERLRALQRVWETDTWPGEVDIYLLAICGFDSGVAAAADVLEEIGLPGHARAAVALDDSDRCFHDRSRIFPDPDEREQARALVFERGLVLEPKHPLGYRDTQAAVSFEMRCPNNSLPILWKDAPSWRSLFPRMGRGA